MRLHNNLSSNAVETGLPRGRHSADYSPRRGHSLSPTPAGRDAADTGPPQSKRPESSTGTEGLRHESTGN